MAAGNELSGSLRGRILSSVKLSSLQFASQIALRLISTIVLTRLLAPEIYGVFAVVLLYRYLLEMFSDLLDGVAFARAGHCGCFWGHRADHCLAAKPWQFFCGQCLF